MDLSVNQMIKILYPLALLTIILLPNQRVGELSWHGLRVMPADLALGAALLVWLVLIAWFRVTPHGQNAVVPPIPRIPACHFALLAVALASMIVADLSRVEVKDWLQSAVRELAQLIEYLLVGYLIFSAAFQHSRRLNTALWVWFGSSALVIAWGLGELFLQPHAAYVGASFGTHGFAGRHAYSTYLALALPALLGTALTEQRRWMQLLLVCLVIGGVVSILSPGGLLVVLISLTLVSAWHSRRAAALCVGGIALFLLVLPVLLPRNYSECVQKGCNFLHGRDVKKVYLEPQAVLNLFERHSLLGVGIGNYQANIGQYYFSLPNTEKLEEGSTGGYWLILGSMGWLGLCSLVALLLYHRRLINEAARRASLSLWTDQRWALALRGSLAGFVLASLFSNVLVRGTGLAFALVLSSISSSSMKERGE